MKKKIATGCLVHSHERVLDGAHTFDPIGPACPLRPTLPAEALTTASGAAASQACSSNGPGLQNNGLVVGTTWNGTITKVSSKGKCSGYPPMQTLSCQITESDYAGDLTLVCANNFAVYDATNVGHACTVETGMVASYYGTPTSGGQIIVEPKAGISDYSNCTTGAPALPYGWSGTATPGLTQITAQDSDLCTKILLVRGASPPAPPGPGPGPSPHPPPPPPPPPLPPSGCHVIGNPSWDHYCQNGGAAPSSSCDTGCSTTTAPMVVCCTASCCANAREKFP